MTTRSKFILGIVILFLLALAACNQAATPLPLPNLTAGEWSEFDGDTGTVCASGSDYKYFVNKGTVNKLVIDFQGGGACFNDATCLASYQAVGEENALYADTIATTTADLNAGLYNHSNSANPVKDWYHVHIPYCTGDLHMGNNTKEYVNPQNQVTYTIEHKGAVNAKSVLDWTFDTFTNPDEVFITGCSAGAYGATFWTETIKANYPDTQVYQLGDCGVGASTDGFGALVQANWNVNKPLNAEFVNTTYINTANKYKTNLSMAQYHTLFDNTQVKFYALITGQLDPDNAQQVAVQWSGIMQDSIAKIESQTSNFSSYLAQGSQHCIIPSNELYNKTENGIKLVDWLTDYLSGKSVADIKPAAIP
ncbi:MAG: hypothetical protein KC422_05745 [Trueperaceae bacterium]|nr:hypothetical protein [Trueperaceae bacterium]